MTNPWDEIDVTVVATEFNVEYAGCGSHKMEIHAKVERRDFLDMMEQWAGKLEVTDE